MCRRMAVLADDLSGAHVSAARLRSVGLRTFVTWRSDDLQVYDDGSVVVDMRTRDRPCRALEVAADWARLLMYKGFDHLELRMDSTLRSRTCEELAGVRSAFREDPLVLLAPAFPSAGRTTIEGRQLVHGQPVTPQPDVRLLCGELPSQVISVAVLERGPREVQDLVDGAVSRGVRGFVFDGWSDHHLRLFAHTVSILRGRGRSVLTVSPGAWLGYCRTSPFVLFVIGSNSNINVRQLDRLRTGPATAVIPALEDTDPIVSSGALDLASTIVVHTTGTPARPEVAACRAARAASDVLAAQAFRACAGIVATGGHTASHLVDALGASAVLAVDEPEPLCARGVLSGGRWDGVLLVTKGGQVGGPETLCRLRDALAPHELPMHSGVIERGIAEPTSAASPPVTLI